MPYQSEAQRIYMHIHHPKIASRWDKKYGKTIRPKQPKRSTRKK